MIRRPFLHRRLLAVAGFLLAGILPATAHDPYEVSALMVVFHDHMELRVSAGSDIARIFLKTTGFTPHQIAGMTRPDGAVTKLDAATPPGLPFFDLRDGPEDLTPTSWTVISNDTEIRFTGQFARPKAGAVEVRARYFTVSADVRPGAFVAVSPEKELVTTVLSPDSASLRVPIPPPESAEADAHAPPVVPHLSATPPPSVVR